jgi:hypothetical protein
MACGHFARMLRHSVSQAVVASSVLAAFQALPTVRADSTATYTGPASGSWNVAGNWSGGVIPTNGNAGQNYVVVIDGNAAQSSTVTTDGSFTIDGLTITSGDALSITNNTGLTLNNSTLSNAGVISIAAGANFTDLIIPGTVALTGGGTLNLTSNARIRGGGTLINANNLIDGDTTGSGTFGNNDMAIVNQINGIIDANASGKQLLVDPVNGAGLSNAGIMRATNGGQLVLTGNGGGAFDNTGGMILANGTSSIVYLVNSASVFNGTLATSNGGTIHTFAGNGSFLTNVANTGSYVVENNAATTFNGTINNTGVISLAAAGNFTDFILGGNVSLNGNGTVTLQNADRIRGGSTLTIGSAQTIQGETSNSGSIGNNDTAIVNNGLINANVNHAPLVGNQALLIDPVNIASGFTNSSTGTLEATNGGFLMLTGNGGGDFNNQGLILASGTGSEVQLVSSVSITGGSLTSTAGGIIRTLSGNASSLTNVTLNANYIVANNAATFFAGTITNLGTITVAASGSVTDFIVPGTVTLTGGGTLNLQDAARVRGGGELINVNNVIQGDTNNTTSLGNNDMVLVNQSGGLIDANHAGLALVIDPANGPGMTNAGVMRATNGGVLVLSGNGAGGFDNTGGTILANGTSSLVELVSNASVSNGTFNTLNGGQILVPSGHQAFLTNVTSTGAIVTQNNTTLNLGGTIANIGSITIGSTTSTTDLVIGGTVTLTGGGKLSLSSADRIRGGGTLINVNNLIQGDTNIGTFGNNDTAIVNQGGGVINANNPGMAMFIDPVNVLGLVNQNIMEATNGGILQLSGNGGGAFDNTLGVILASGSASSVQLLSNASIFGGTLTTTSGGQFILPSTHQAFLTNLVNAGTLVTQNNTTLNLGGTITNTATITIGSTVNTTDLVASGSVTLTGGGTLNLMSVDRIRGGGPFINVNNVIQGDTNVGTFGNNDTSIINQAGGVIDANNPGMVMYMDPINIAGLINQNIMEATNGGILQLSGNGGGAFDNTAGVILASGTSSSVQLIVNASVFGGTLTTTNGGQFILPANNQAFLTNLVNAGTFVAQNNTTLNLGGTITNTGNITIASTQNLTDLVASGSVTLTGGGTLNLTGGDRIRGGGPLINVNNVIQGDTSFGTFGNNDTAIVNQSAGVIDANNPGKAMYIDPVNGVGMTNTGLMEATNGGILQLSGNGGGAFNNTGGVILSNGTASLVQFVSNASVSGGTLTSANGGQFSFPAGTTTTLNQVALQIDTLNVAGGLVLTSNDTVGATSIVSSLVIAGGTNAWTGRLDIGVNRIVIAPTANKATQLSQIQNQLAQGRNGGNWQGNGITSSSAIADSAHKGVFVVDNALLGLTMFGTQAVDANSLLLEATYLGDANLDRRVDVTDLGILATNYGKTVPNGIIQGDFNQDGKVDVTDLGILATDYGLGVVGGFTIVGSSVPEPASLAILLVGAGWLTRRRRR